MATEDPTAIVNLVSYPLHAHFNHTAGVKFAILPVSSRQLTRSEVYALAALYWPSEEIQHAVDIAELESNFWTASRNGVGEDSRGLWQINLDAHGQLARFNLFDPQINAYFAHQIWESAGGWSPWYNAAVKLGLL